ncbi:MAG: zincin-like metallopeptidase domain-containing protein [Candidatus Sulfotelmatobacter sp.]
MNNYERITAAMQNALAGDLPPWRRPWRTLRASGASGIPQNAVSGHAYRGINACLLWVRQDADARYLTFRQACELGGHVRKGEHGAQVVFWQKRQYKTRDDNGEEELRDSLLMKVYTVFALSQCENVTLPKPRHDPPPLVPPPAMTEVYSKIGATVDHDGDRACFVPSHDKVIMPRPEAFTSPDAYSATALHELTHWTGHESRLARGFGKRFGDQAYAAEELVAELGSAFLCASLGVDCALEHHASYLDHWRKLLRSDPRAIITAASKAQAATDYLLARIQPAHAEAADNDAMEAAA